MASFSGKGSAPLSIEMLGHDQARNVDELWAGKSDVKERRRLQNRLNRRAYSEYYYCEAEIRVKSDKRLSGKRQSELRLQRKHELEADAVETIIGRRSKKRKIPGSYVFPVSMEEPTHKSRRMFLNDLIQSSKLSLHGSDLSEDLARHSSPKSGGHAPHIDLGYIPVQHTIQQSLLSPERLDSLHDPCTDDDGSNDALLEESLVSCNDGQAFYPLTSDHLITLVYYNVFRGLSKNIRALKLDRTLMRTRDYQSPFITGDIDVSTLAPDFQPTLIQQTIPHHPCFDIFPDAVVRDNAIRNWAADLPYGHLCMNLAGRSNWNEIELPARLSCVLWGAADNADNWEVTEGFASMWPYLAKGAYRLQAATNRWRAMRGERPIWFA